MGHTELGGAPSPRQGGLREVSGKPQTGQVRWFRSGGSGRLSRGDRTPQPPGTLSGGVPLGRENGPGLHLVPLPVPVPEEVLRGRTEERRRRRTHPRALRGHGMVSGSERVAFDDRRGPTLCSTPVATKGENRLTVSVSNVFLGKE